MSDTVIRVENLSKKYIIRHQQSQQYTALRDVIADGVKSIGRRLSGAKQDSVMGSTQEEFWALKDVSFEVKQGDRPSCAFGHTRLECIDIWNKNYSNPK